MPPSGRPYQITRDRNGRPVINLCVHHGDQYAARAVTVTDPAVEVVVLMAAIHQGWTNVTRMDLESGTIVWTEHGRSYVVAEWVTTGREDLREPVVAFEFPGRPDLLGSDLDSAVVLVAD